MDDFMLWVLSNVGGLGIFLILVVALSLLLLLLGSVSGKCSSCHNNPIIIIPMIIILGTFICGLVGLYISANNTSAPVSWFKNLSAGEIDEIQSSMSNGPIEINAIQSITPNEPMTISQFNDAQQNYRNWVKLRKQERAQFNAMNGGLKNG